MSFQIWKDPGKILIRNLVGIEHRPESNKYQMKVERNAPLKVIYNC